MQIIGDIITDLVDNDKSLGSALLKTKVLAKRVKNIELLDWVNKELNGYELGDVIPEYRKCFGIVFGTFFNAGWQYNDYPIATYGLPKEHEQKFRQMEFLHSVTALEAIEKENKSGILENSFPPELSSMLERNMRRQGNYDFTITRATRRVSKASLIQVLAKIRSLLLDFMLKIDEEFGNITKLDDLIGKNEIIKSIMHQTIVNTGDGNILNTGDNVKISAEITVQKNDKVALKRVLAENGIPEHDIDELLEIIDKDEPDKETKTFGGKVNDWIKKMIGKALNGSWQISIGAAGTLLSKLIMDYYGI